LVFGREDLCRLRIEQLTDLASYLGYEVSLSSRPNSRCSGLIRFGQRIAVWASSPELRLSVLAHEICHAGLWELRVTSSFIERDPGGRVEEGLCYAFESFMLGVLLDQWPDHFRGADLCAVHHFLSRFVEHLRLRLLHRCINLTEKKIVHEEALELATGVREGLLSFEERWREGRYEEIRDTATDIFEDLFDLVALCNSLIEVRKSQTG
jgi:hypothetical protein